MASDSYVELTVGDVVNAVVEDVHKSYAILTLGEVKAYLPSTEFSWGKNVNLKKALKTRPEIQAVVISITDRGVMLSVKRLEKHLWDHIDELYKIGQKTRGKIINIVSFGAFVQLADGIQGLLHKNEMSIDGNIEPETIVEKGNEIDVIVISIEKAEHKISFSIKPFVTNNS